MSDDPANAELARLAQQGQRRIHAAGEDQSQVAQLEANQHLRVAIGAVRGSPFRRMLLVPMVAGLAVAIIGLVLTIHGAATAVTAGAAAAHNATTWVPMIPLGFVAAMGGFMGYVFTPPTASRAQVAAEQAWVAGLPFVLEGHFETLSAAPEVYTG